MCPQNINYQSIENLLLRWQRHKRFMSLKARELASGCAFLFLPFLDALLCQSADPCCQIAPPLSTLETCVAYQMTDQDQ